MKSWWGGTNPLRYRLYERWLRAELLHAAGRDTEALLWYETAHQLVAGAEVFLAPAHLRQAQIHERLGHRDQAITHHRRFIDIWKDCDPELRPQVEDARARVAALVAAGG